MPPALSTFLFESKDLLSGEPKIVSAEFSLYVEPIRSSSRIHIASRPSDISLIVDAILSNLSQSGQVSENLRDKAASGAKDCAGPRVTGIGLP